MQAVLQQAYYCLQVATKIIFTDRDCVYFVNSYESLRKRVSAKTFLLVFLPLGLVVIGILAQIPRSEYVFQYLFVNANQLFKRNRLVLLNRIYMVDTANKVLSSAFTSMSRVMILLSEEGIQFS